MKLPILIILCACAFPISVKSQNDTIIAAKELKEVTVSGKLIRQEADHYNCIPTNKQRRHSHSGFDLVRNMMIAGVNADTETGSILTPGGAATLYINGREASYREIQSLRPKDVLRIEYYDMPTGKYAKDKAVLNYVVRNYTDGGYTQVDALQTLGFLKGDYNLTSKYSFGHYNANIWAGYGIENLKSDAYSTERYGLPTEITKQTRYLNQEDKSAAKYFTASLSRITDKQTWMVRASIEAEKQRNNSPEGSTQYIKNGTADRQHSSFFNRNTTLKPTFYAYYNRSIGKNQNLDANIDAYYARNKYQRTLTENNTYQSDVAEDYFYSKLNVNYTLSLPKHNSFTVSLHEYFRSSQDNYAGVPPTWQHLRSSETILFADYSKRWSKFMLDANPGVSYLVYKLRGDDAVKHLAPRLQLSASWMPDKVQRFRAFFSLGNTFPTLSSTNRVEQQIDPIMIRRGNPNMDNSTLLSPGFTYSVNYKQWSALLSTYYMYISNAIVNTYTIDGSHIINSFSSNTRSHQTSAALSLTWKPSENFNIKADGGYTHYAVNRAVRERQSNWRLNMQAYYYIGDFSFSAFYKSPVKSLANFQTHVRTPWQYGITGEWSHDNFAIVLDAKNLFIEKNKIRQSLSADNYDFTQIAQSDIENSYASVKFLYTVEYGKKVRRSPQYTIKKSESTILR